MPKFKDICNKYSRSIIFVVFMIVFVSLIVRHFSAFGNILLVMLGFGAVVLVHEFGHFITAKLSNIKVEAFSIFMPPILLGIQRTEEGIRFRILPEIFPKEGDGSGEGALNFTIGKKGKDGETEYRIGLIPFGGFVKMLGQDDIGAVKTSDDPRSFANKPVHTRAATIAAGVVFNVISAIIIFMIAFLIGINLPPAIVGNVIQNSPAARAGLKPGDEIIEIAGQKKDLDFSNIEVAAALSGKNEQVPIKVKHTDNSEEIYHLKAELLPGEQMRLFGIIQAKSLTIAQLKEKDANEMYSKTGLLPGDRITSVNGREVRGHWELIEILQNSYLPKVTLSAERTDSNNQVETIESQISLNLNVAKNSNPESNSDLNHIYSMVPRIQVFDPQLILDTVKSESQNRGISGKFSSFITWIRNKISSEPDKTSVNEDLPKHPLHAGDIILAVGDINNPTKYPTFKELRDITVDYKDKELPITVLRVDPNGVEQTLTVNVIPKSSEDGERVAIGIAVVLDAEHPIIAKTITIEDGPEKLEIPSGAAITSVDGTPVSNFYDIIREIKKYPGERITIDWRIDSETAGNVALNVSSEDDFITVKSNLVEDIPFERLERLYDADGPIEAIVMGFRRTVTFIAQTYITLKRLIGGLVSPKNLMGPVGIMKISYHIVAEQTTVYYVYFLGLISAVIAVFNFLPMPPLDGGLIVLLIIEKIKGSAISERIQTIIAYTSWTLILALLIYVTFNDILRFFS